MINYFTIILIISLTISGGMSDIGVAIAGAMICVFTISSHRFAKKRIFNKKESILFSPIIVIAWSVIVSIWAIDYSTNLLGCMRLCILLMWVYLLCVYDDMADRLMHVLPYISAISIPLSIMCHYTSILPNTIIAKRLSGPFQYANTYGMFILLCIIITVSELEKVDKCDNTKLLISASFINILGLFFTGSRSSMLLFLIWIIYKMICSKALRLKLGIIVALLLAISLIAYFGFGNTQTLGRLFTLTNAATSKTVAERMIYYKDGFSYALSHPFGLGYLGYEYMQGSFQSSPYETVFIHNDLLQLILDYGFLTAIVMITYFAYQLVKGKQGRVKKELLIVLLVGSLVDFHLQYLFMGMVMCLMLDLPKMDELAVEVFKKKKVKINQSNTLEKIILYYSIVSLIILLYMSVVFIADTPLNNYDLALRLCPEYTQSQEHRLEQMDDFEAVDRLSSNLIKKNKYNPKALTARAVICELTGDYEGMCYAMERSLLLDRYNEELYNEYEQSLNELIDNTDGDIKNRLAVQKDRNADIFLRQDKEVGK